MKSYFDMKDKVALFARRDELDQEPGCGMGEV